MIRALRASRLLATLSVAALLGQGCLGSSQPATGPDGGVYRTKNAGQEWTQAKTLNLDTKLGSIANVVTVSMAFDPQDPTTMYLGTNENGLLLSTNGGDSWNQIKGLTAGRINAIAVDAKDKCTVYVASGNRLWKTTNCFRDVAQIYTDTRPTVVFTSVVADWFNSQVLYLATSEGDILKTENAGMSWRAAHRVEGTRIHMLTMDPRDSRLLYAATAGSGLLKSVDGGTSWTAIKDQLTDFDRARSAYIVSLDPKNAGVVYLVAKHGVLKSDDAGATWKALTLPTPASAVDIRAFAIHPNDPRGLVYATDTAIVFSADSGSTWTSKKLPTRRGVTFLEFNREPLPALFLGTSAPKN